MTQPRNADPAGRLEAHKARVRTSHAAAFALHVEVADIVESAMLVPRAHPTNVSLVTDMLLLQAYKAHLSVCVLCEHAFVEDAATITRRLLELSVQAAYLTAPTTVRDQERRAGQYLVHMWRRFPRRFRALLPVTVRAHWTDAARRYGRFVPKGAKSWGPNFRRMFEDIGHVTTYHSDHRLLSSIAHGSPDEQIIAHSRPTIQITPHHNVGLLLVFSSRYYLALAGCWTEQRSLLDRKRADKVFRQLNRWRPRAGAA